CTIATPLASVSSRSLNAAATDNSTLSLHDALPISIIVDASNPTETFPTITLTSDTGSSGSDYITSNGGVHFAGTVSDSGGAGIRTEEHTSETQPPYAPVCRLRNGKQNTTLAAGTYS